MSRQTGTTERVRAILRAADGPLSIAQIIDALPDSMERNNVSSLLHQRKRAGEFAVTIIDRKPHYALAPGYVPLMPQRNPLGRRTDATLPPPAPKRAPHSGAPTAGAAPAVSVSPASPTTPKAANPHAAPMPPGNPIAARPAPAGLTLRIHLDFGDLPAQLRALAATLDGLRAAP